MTPIKISRFLHVKTFLDFSNDYEIKEYFLYYGRLRGIVAARGR